MDFELWPQFSDFAQFLCAFALKMIMKSIISSVGEAWWCFEQHWTPSGLDSSSCRDHRVVFLGNTVNLHSGSLHPGVPNV